MSTVAPWCTARWRAWRSRSQRGPHPCDACPVEAACSAPLPGALTLEAIAAHARRLEEAWQRYQEMNNGT